MNLKSHSYFSFSNFRAPIRNTADYSPFGIQLDGRTLSYVPPAPAPPSVTVVYQHKFDDNPSTHPYTTAPNQLNTKLTNVSWTNSQSSWTNFAGYTGKAIATNSATPDTTRLYLNLTVNSGFMLNVKSYSFYHRSSTTGYTNYQLLVNGLLVGSGSIFVSSGSTLQSTGTINVANAIAGLTGSVTVTLKLFGGSNGNNATFRLDDFTLNGYTQEVQVYAEGYRRGFNGMEKDDEVKGAGNSYDYGARMYDARVGRWMSVDNIVKLDLSSYQYARLNPIIYIDGDGNDEHIFWNTYQYYINNGQFFTWNDGNKDWKIPKADEIIKDGKKYNTYFLAVPSYRSPSEYKASFSIRPNSPSSISSEKAIEELKRNLEAEVKGEAEGSLYQINWHVSESISRETKEKQIEVVASVSYFNKVQMNSPMTISGGDNCKGYSSISDCPISTNDVKKSVASWADVNNLPPSYSLNLGVHYLRYKQGDCVQNIICAFKEASQENGEFDFKQQLKSSTLYNKNGVLYNRNEMGNYLWGLAGKTAGFSLSELEKGGDDYKGKAKDEPWEKRAYKKGYKEK